MRWILASLSGQARLVQPGVARQPFRPVLMSIRYEGLGVDSELQVGSVVVLAMLPVGRRAKDAVSRMDWDAASRVESRMEKEVVSRTGWSKMFDKPPALSVLDHVQTPAFDAKGTEETPGTHLDEVVASSVVVVAGIDSIQGPALRADGGALPLSWASC